MKKADTSTITEGMLARWRIPGYTKENQKIDIETAYKFRRDSRIARWMTEACGRSVETISAHLGLSVPLVKAMVEGPSRGDRG